MTILDDTDGRPVSEHRAGDPIPGGVFAWERLGVGHRCETWLAWSPEVWQPVVVKFPRPDQLAHPRARRSLAREVDVLRDNLHPGLPRLYADGSAAHVPHIVLEHVDGLALDDELDDRGALDDIEVARLGVQLLAALRAVHRRGRAHVDIKPANVILRDGRPVLLDFGSARRIGAAQPAGRLIGSPGYAAPDLEAGEAISTAMDVFGVGLTLWEARTGTIAFDPDLPAGARPPLPALTDSVLTRVLARMTDPDPAERLDADIAISWLAAVADPDGTSIRPRWAEQCPGSSGEAGQRVGTAQRR